MSASVDKRHFMVLLKKVGPVDDVTKCCRGPWFSYDLGSWLELPARGVKYKARLLDASHRTSCVLVDNTTIILNTLTLKVQNVSVNRLLKFL